MTNEMRLVSLSRRPRFFFNQPGNGCRGTRLLRFSLKGGGGKRVCQTLVCILMFRGAAALASRGGGNVSAVTKEQPKSEMVDYLQDQFTEEDIANKVEFASFLKKRSELIGAPSTTHIKSIV